MNRYSTLRRALLSVVASLTLLFPAARGLDAAWEWSVEDGWVDPDDDVPNTAASLLRESEKAFAAKRYPEAALGYRLLLDSFPVAPERVRAELQLVESEFLAKRYDDCLEVIEEVLDRRPEEADLVSKLVQRKYEIGAAYLAGTKRRFFGMSWSAENRGVEILDALVERFPYQRYSDDALYHIGAHFQRRREFLEAEIAYERLIQDYPQSDWASLAEYQIGESALSRLKGVEYDFAPVAEAEKRFRRYLRLYPGGDKTQEARRGLARSSQLRAEKLFGIAQFYQREGKPKAVRVYLVRLLRDHPNVPIASEASELLRKIPPDRDSTPGTEETGTDDDA